MNQNMSSDVSQLQKQLEDENRVDATFGIHRLSEPGEHIGYMYNMRESYVLKGQEQQVCSALECYFVRQNLTSFKVKIQYDPYILLQCPRQNSA